MSGSSLLNEHYALRRSLTEDLVAHLVGPESPNEILERSPLDVYSLGSIHPPSNEMTIDEEVLDDDVQEMQTAEDSTSDEAISLANRQFPTSMGLSFAVHDGEGESDALVISVECGTYEPTDEGGWARTHHVPEPVRIPLGRNVSSEKELIPGLHLGWRVRPRNVDSDRTITVYLRNTNDPERDRKLRARTVFFQPQITVALEGAGARFTERPEATSFVSDAERESDLLLYRHTRNLAIGHGCSVMWADEAIVDRLKTTFVPTHDVRRAESNPEIRSACLDMRSTERLPKSEVIESMRHLVEGYEAWIESRSSELAPPPVGKVPSNLVNAGYRHLDDCRQAARRMRVGIGMLESGDASVYRAFDLMSRVMVAQRVRSVTVLAGRDDDPATIVAEWRPFQLAFILQCLPGLVDDQLPDRDIADLLWFPTGGGKTEAYLGLIAFDMMLRRLTGRTEGVAALMRYTLRLLTTQQFERAALMICCCEDLRLSGSFGIDGVPFGIGLYVGRETTPNNRKDASKALSLLRSSLTADVSRFGNPIQVSICVWCGSRIGPEHYREAPQVVPCCPNGECRFHDGLPWFVVDEDIYEMRPDLIIGTVDKFAMMPLTENAGAIFNRLTNQDPGIDLIIQDELHLISGPLGTIVGLYEIAFDELGRRSSGVGGNGPRPKLIASTATIRRAKQQVEALFDRQVAQFPPPGLDARDSYFAVEGPEERVGTRRYVGVLAPALSQTTALVRVYALLFHRASVGTWSDRARDAYWTLVAYFGSLRLMASAQLLMYDDVKDRIELIARPNAATRVPGSNLIELTSRATSREIPEFLRQLRLSFPAKGTVETLLATNMISVGVDIDRLGLMVMAGQPQSTAEYIQSSSRVGRQDPGLVVTVYNAVRSRDRSHYETFLNYHSAFYRQVEGSSVTPFSPQARSRALAAVLVVLVRFLVPVMRQNTSAGLVEHHLSDVRAAAELIVARANRIDPAEAPSVLHELNLFISGWRTLAATHGTSLVYHDWRSSEKSLLVTSAEEEGLMGAASVMTSMRNVDATCQLYEVKGGVRRVAG